MAKSKLTTEIIYATIRENDHAFLSKFFKTDICRIIYGEKGLVFPIEAEYGKRIVKENGKFIEYHEGYFEEPEKQTEQLDLF